MTAPTEFDQLVEQALRHVHAAADEPRDLAARLLANLDSAPGRGVVGRHPVPAVDLATCRRGGGGRHRVRDRGGRDRNIGPVGLRQAPPRR